LAIIFGALIRRKESEVLAKAERWYASLMEERGMADLMAGDVAPQRPRGRGLRAAGFLALAVCVALVGLGGGAVAGIVFGAAHSAPSTASTSLAHLSATPTATVSPPCHCTSVTTTMPQPSAGVPQYGGQVILVSLSKQWLWAYQDQQLVLASPVTTGMPQLPTPRGSYAVQRKETNVTFYSLWPQGSPFYYSPEHINYAMYFRDIGYYIHDAPWRHAFGPGTQYPHIDPDGTHETGSHGCVNMPTPAATTLYHWVGLGARVIIVS
jgi:lipoprotein-anchoring transpeptidase ErfK/SrfK